MKLLRQIVEPHLETLLAAKGIEHGMWASALQPSRESDQGDLTLPCFAFASILRKHHNRLPTPLQTNSQNWFACNR